MVCIPLYRYTHTRHRVTRRLPPRRRRVYAFECFGFSSGGGGGVVVGDRLWRRRCLRSRRWHLRCSNVRARYSYSIASFSYFAFSFSSARTRAKYVFFIRRFVCVYAYFINRCSGGDGRRRIPILLHSRGRLLWYAATVFRSNLDLSAEVVKIMHL